FQRGMERYWCLRWLRQQQESAVVARHLRESLVRLERLPLVLRVPSLPTLERGTRVRLAIEDIDLLEAECRARYVETLAAEGSDATFGEDEDAE
ncbi:MAG TPA: RNB domain-containing ribonuclease, partial [Rhodocyclaceae bacterium]|nr:RNB domain-containing ribonuclease [Rhodocyclaceae bacterium]